MEVILLERVERLGGIGDTVRVKDGYARNYLIPQGKALRANKNNLAVFEARKAEIEAENAKKRAEAEKLSGKIQGLTVTIIRQASEDGRLFGSVTARDISTAAAAKIEGVSHKHVRLNDSIKATGIYNIKLVLHPEVTLEIRANIARSESEAAEALDALLNPKKSKKAKDEAAEEVVESNEQDVAAEAGDAEQAA